MRQAEEEARSGEKAKEEAAWGEVLAADQAMTVALWRASAEKAAKRTAWDEASDAKAAAAAAERAARAEWVEASEKAAR